MRIKIFYLYVLLFYLVTSCTKDAEPEMKHYPIIQTSDVTNIDSKGATFNAEIINIGIDNIIQYGFVFDTQEPGIDVSFNKTLVTKAQEGKFSITLNDNLAGNLDYIVKAYARTGTNIIYGNEVEFHSKGSQWNPWDLCSHPIMDGWDIALGMSNSSYGFILFQGEDFYSFNPSTNAISKKQSIPINGNTGTYYASFTLNNSIYVLTNDSPQILKYDIINDQWTEIGTRPFSPNGYIGFCGFSINNVGYFLSRGNFYAFNAAGASWVKKADIPTNYIYSAQVIENSVYVFGANKGIWKYLPANDSWQLETEYPGSWKSKIIGFSLNNKIYWGLSYYGGYTDAPPPAKDLWEYNPVTQTWKQITDFPLLHSQDKTFAFSISSTGYFGFNPDNVRSDQFHLFKFNPGKIKE